MKRKIAVIIGSLRKESFNRKIAKALIKLAPDSLEFEFIEIGQLPHYSEDHDGENPPAPWIQFREAIKACDGVLFVTPEYNRSVPGVLKNAIDVGSRPYGQSAWNGKPTAVISVSPGNIGGFGANHHLRQCFVFLNMPCLQEPESYIGQVTKLLDDKGNISNESTQKFLKTFIEKYSDWVDHNLPT